MKRAIIIITTLVICFTCLKVDAEVGTRNFEEAGGFSLSAPSSWNFREFPGLKYKIAAAPGSNTFTPNINIVDEKYDGNLKSYVDANISTLKNFFTNFNLIERSTFKTKKGTIGEKVITTSIQQNYKLMQTFYFIPGKNNKFYVVTCSVLEKEGNSYDPIFEESIRTFELIE